MATRPVTCGITAAEASRTGWSKAPARPGLSRLTASRPKACRRENAAVFAPVRRDAKKCVLCRDVTPPSKCALANPPFPLKRWHERTDHRPDLENRGRQSWE